MVQEKRGDQESDKLEGLPLIYEFRIAARFLSTETK